MWYKPYKLELLSVNGTKSQLRVSAGQSSFSQVA